MPISVRHRKREAAMSTQSVLGNSTSPGIEHASHPYYSASGQQIAPRRTPKDQRAVGFCKRGLQAAMPCLSTAH